MEKKKKKCPGEDRDLSITYRRINVDLAHTQKKKKLLKIIAFA